MRKLGKAYFENLEEISMIKEGVWRSIPQGYFYHNIILALADVLSECVRLSLKEELFNKSHTK